MRFSEFQEKDFKFFFVEKNQGCRTKIKFEIIMSAFNF
jgi:hypothetical protein